MRRPIPKEELASMRERAMAAPANGGSVTDIIRLVDEVERLNKALEFIRDSHQGE